MTSSLGGSVRRCRGLTDIVPQYDDSQSDKSQISSGSGDSDFKYGSGSIRIQHLTGSCALGRSRFPKLEECAHFHYEHVELGSLQISLYEEEDLKSLSSLEYGENSENKWLTVKVISQGQNWLLRRTYENFRMLDQQLHQCIYDRKFSSLPELPPLENLPEKQDPQTYIKNQLNKYCERFSEIAGSLINCGPVLSWLQLDNRGRRILVTDGDSCPINTPAVAAAYAVKKYTAVAADEISFDIGDMISVIDMPPPEDSIWWRGKRGFMVGFFPSQCVAVITDKVPRNLQLNQHSNIIEPSKPVLRKHGKLIAFFRAFILSRPSKRHLKQSGILKERVFGCDLGEHLLNSGRDVPMVLKCCSEFIEQHGIVDGIYRLSGATSNIQKLRTTFDEDRIPALYHDDSILQDIHSVASLLKMYFRELPNPLCTYQLYKNFVNAVQNADPAERVTCMREVVQKLPPPHFRTLEFLMRHLSKVAEHGTRTGMTARNIAIVWAPNLLRCKELEFGGVAALQGVGVQAVVTEFLISNVDLVFCTDQISMHEGVSGTAKRIRPKSLSLGTPTRLLSLEEAQSKRLGSEHSHENYIEVGGGPSCLPKIYHTVIELPTRKRIPLKRSPLGWKSLFSRGSGGSTSLRKSASTNSGKRKTSIPNEITYKHADLTKKTDSDVKIRLRTVKSAESLTSGLGNGASVRNSVCLDFLSPPSPKLCGTSGHSRSVSHDSYFDHLAESTPMHSTLQDDDKEGLSDLHVNFDLDESEMKIFSEESSQLFSNTSSSEQLQPNMKKVPLLASAENTIIVDPSPKKHKTSGDNSSCSSATLSDDMTAVSNKRSRLEERLLDGDFAYIDSQCNDRLVVEVDVHHRETSQISSPMTDEAGCTISDTTITNINVPYTPLSECSCTTSSNFEFSYQRLSSSMSSSQLPRSSNESVKTSDGKKYENVPGNRLSYQGELRAGAVPVRNRLSLQTLTPGVEGDHHFESIRSSNTAKDAQIELKLNDKSYKNEPGDRKVYENSCDVYCSKEAFSDKMNGTLYEEVEWKSDRCKDQEDRQGYENVPKMKLVLNDKEMFSDAKSPESTNESPYELVTMVGNRMTSVSMNDVVMSSNKNISTDSNYEEIEPVCSARCMNNANHLDDDNYEKMSSSVCSENEIYNFEGSVGDKGKSNYEEISILGDDLASMRDCMSSSNESLESSADEAMIENNLYESLVAEDSSPDLASNRFANIKENGIISSDEKANETANNFKNFVMTINSPEKIEHPEIISNDQCPLLKSENPSPYSDSEPVFFDDKEPTKDEQICLKENDLQNSDSIFNGDKHDKNNCRPSSLPIPQDNEIYKEPLLEQNTRQDYSNCKEENEENREIKMNNLRSGCTKSVQDLVSRFEWSAENDFSNTRKDTTSRNKSLSPDYSFSKKEYFSLPPVLVKRKPSSDFSTSTTMQSSNDEKDDPTVRRDRIEKYKEERRLALRQKYQVDGDLNDQKDEEMIRRFKQKIQKNEKNSHDFDSSPDADISIESEESATKEKPSAVTTISILYTSRRKRDSTEVENDEKPNETKDSTNDVSSKNYSDKFENSSSTKTKTITNSYSGNSNKELKPGSLLLKSFSTDRIEPTREWSLKPNSCDVKRPFTASLERKIKNSGNVESLVAKRVNQLSGASESSEFSRIRRSGEIGSMRQRAHSTSGPIAPYCIRDIAAIFENKDNNKQ